MLIPASVIFHYIFTKLILEVNKQWLYNAILKHAQKYYYPQMFLWESKAVAI